MAESRKESAIVTFQSKTLGSAIWYFQEKDIWLRKWFQVEIAIPIFVTHIPGQIAAEWWFSNADTGGILPKVVRKKAITEYRNKYRCH